VVMTITIILLPLAVVNSRGWAAVLYFLSLTPFRKIGIIDDGSHFFGFAGGRSLCPRTQISSPQTQSSRDPCLFLMWTRFGDLNLSPSPFSKVGEALGMLIILINNKNNN
jgi:hypothetical protein